MIRRALMSATVLAASALAVSAAAWAQQDPMAGLLNPTQREAARQLQGQMFPGQPPPARPQPQPPAPRPQQPAFSSDAIPVTVAIRPDNPGPRAVMRVSQTPQNLWLSVGRDQKFIPPDGKPQIIATNPYLNPDRFVFAVLDDMNCLADGSLMVSGEGYQNGDIAGTGWWKIAPDGAVTPFITSVYHERTGLPPSGYFGVAADGGVIAVSRYAIYRLRGGVSQRIAGAAGETQGYQDGPGAMALFKDPGSPIEDNLGNLWVTDQNGCVLRRITPDGAVSTVIGSDRSICGKLPVGDRIALNTIAWDKANNEIVAGGYTIVGQPTHDMHVSIWRIQPSGLARRVYYTVKAGRSPIGQNMDAIWATAVDQQGRIHVASKPMADYARRQIMRLDETTKRLVSLTGSKYNHDDLRPGHEEDPYDGIAAHSNFRESKRMCFGPDRSLFVLDEHLVRRVNTDGTVRTWAY